MGKVVEKLKLTNSIDLANARTGLIPKETVRSVEVDALVDTGATMMVIPHEVALKLGLPFDGTRDVRYADGRVEKVPRIKNVQIELLGRDMTCDALVAPKGTVPLIGQIPLEGLDLLVDPKSRKLHVNPESPDSPLMDAMVA